MSSTGVVLEESTKELEESDMGISTKEVLKELRGNSRYQYLG